MWEQGQNWGKVYNAEQGGKKSMKREQTLDL